MSAAGVDADRRLDQLPRRNRRDRHLQRGRGPVRRRGRPGRGRLLGQRRRGQRHGARRSSPSDFGDIRFKNDREAYTLAFVPEGDDILPPPPSPTSTSWPASTPATASTTATTSPATTGHPPGGRPATTGRRLRRPPRRRPRRMRAVVLVGGFGTRLRPLTCGTPKQMLPVVDRPMIERVVDHLAEHGVDEAVLSARLPARRLPSTPTPTALRRRRACTTPSSPSRSTPPAPSASPPSTPASTSASSCVNGDVLTDLDVGALVAFHDARGAEGTIALHPVDDPSALRRGAHRRRRPGRRVRREAAPGRGARPT